MYELKFKKKAIKALTKINDPYYSSILKAINLLVENPRPHGYKELIGRNGYRIRVGSYRIIYEIINSNLIIQIVDIGSRGEIYKN
jgi:mRNA interferase RelE/StbE